MRITRESILEAIRETAEANDGAPLGKQAFERQTGIKESVWRGVYWARWSDALKEAEFPPNTAPERLDEDVFLGQLAALVRHLGKLPTSAEIKMRKRTDPSFPAKTTVNNHFRTNAVLFGRLHAFAVSDPAFADVAELSKAYAGSSENSATVETAADEGFVYLIRWNVHYKIGKSNNLERRLREIRVALPEAATLIHVIRTDDPDGIEAYWHRRFGDRRANGEWFALSTTDVAAFRRRKFQ